MSSPETPLTPIDRLAVQLEAMEEDLKGLVKRIERLELLDELALEEADAPRIHSDLPGLYRKRAQARKELAELLAKGVLPVGLGDEAAGDVESTDDSEAAGLAAMIRQVRARFIQQVRPNIGEERNPEISDEEREAEFAEQLGSKK